MNVLPTLKASSVKTYLAEARGLNAYYNLLALDLFGMVFVKADPGAVSKIIRGTEAVDYLIKEFNAIINDLDNTVGPGRLTQNAVYGLLARLHLNCLLYTSRCV